VLFLFNKVMKTRQKRIDYRILNDGSDEEADLEDRILSEDYPILQLS
jgi:hypothetical protein